MDHKIAYFGWGHNITYFGTDITYMCVIYRNRMDREITQSLADIRQQFEVAKLHRVQEQASDEHDHSINSERFVCLEQS